MTNEITVGVNSILNMIYDVLCLFSIVVVNLQVLSRKFCHKRTLQQ